MALFSLTTATGAFTATLSLYNSTPMIQNNNVASLGSGDGLLITSPSLSPATRKVVGVNETFLEEMDSFGNGTSTSSDNKSLPQLTIDMQFNEGHRLAIITYSLLMVISAIGNISVFTAIVRLRIKGRLSRINMFLLHLAIADLLVTFLMMPLEIAWNITVTWDAGDMMCRVMSFFRIFGLYLSGFVLVCISLDRFFAILKPLAIPDANSRGRMMLFVAWLASVLCSLPQPFIFHVEAHPDFPWYKQCITFNAFPSKTVELTYNFFSNFFLYGFPLIMIIFCYTRIIYEIYRINAHKRNDDEQLRRSNMGALGRAKIRTLKMTIIIVAVFFFCWTPYNVMSFWYWFDKKSALEVDQRIQKGLFIFACTNSCVNPLIYGLFHFRPRTNTSVPPSLPNGYRPPKQSENYMMRVRWKPNQCCIMGCGSSGNSEITPAVSVGRDKENHFHVRPSQHFWICNDSGRHCCSRLPEKTPRDITVANGHSHAASNGAVSTTVKKSQNGHSAYQRQRCNSLQMANFDAMNTPSSSLRVTCNGSSVVKKRHFVDDKNHKRTCVSHIL